MPDACELPCAQHTTSAPKKSVQAAGGLITLCPMQVPQAQLESGRLVIVPKRRSPRTPMAQACVLVTAPLGRLYVYPRYVQLAGRPGTAELRRVTVSTEPPNGQTFHIILAHAPYLIIGDHSFIYLHGSAPLTEAGRALRACEAQRRSGSFRADSNDIGVCMRTGWKRAECTLSAASGGFNCDFEVVEQATAAA